MSYNRTVYASPPAKWKNVVYTGETTPVLEGTTWTYINRSNNYTNTYEFRPGGKLVVSGSSQNHTWQRLGNTVSVITHDGYTFYEGTYYRETQRIMGTGENSTGFTFDFTMELVQGSSAPSAAGSSGSANTSRTYAVLVWYTAGGNRLNAVYSVQAASKDEAEREAERQWKTQWSWNQNMQFQEAIAQ
ncbi:hypothetical protein Holit_02610 [Hollandina sp. SP2]